MISLSDKTYKIDSVVAMKKSHPCGNNEWIITRVGADIKLNVINVVELL